MGLFGPDPPRFEKNAPGDFYTTGGCLACGVPENEAPELLAALEGDNCHTYFIRQPTTPEEVERACLAATVCCVDAIRYGGVDPVIIRRLGDRLTYSDIVLPGGPVRFPGESGYSWRRAYRRELYGRRLPTWEKVMLIVDRVRWFFRFTLPDALREFRRWRAKGFPVRRLGS